ncbi:MAG TPA: TIGR04086 family membrane protein [Haloplasmataceae bacterium]
MLRIKKDFFILLIWLLISLFIIAISSVLIYYKIIDVSQNSVYVFACGVILFLFLGFLSGNIRQKKGLLNGILYALSIMIVLFLIQILGFDEKITFQLILKYLIYTLSSGLGGILGVNFKPLIK